MRNLKILFLLSIILLAVFLRFYKLNTVPPSASLDEASIGFNAYSILQTGEDEYGYKFPILLRAYDDWRPALYVYLVIPFVKIFGLDAISVRLPSVILSVLTILATYFLVKKLFKLKTQNSKLKNTIQNSKESEISSLRLEILALLSIGLFAISPLSVYISRLGHEANLGLFFVVFGILFFLLSQRKKTFLILSAIFFALSLYSYQSEKIFAPLIVIALGIIYRKELYKIKKTLLLSIVIGLLISIPILAASFSPQALIRFKGTSAFDASNPLYSQSAKRLLISRQKSDIIGEVLNNRRITSVYIFISQYFSNFNPQWIFENRGNESFKAPGVGLLYFWEAPFLLVGIFSLFKNKYSSKTKAVVASWALIAFVAPSITTQAPHAMRSYNVLPIPQILIGLGILEMGKFFPKKLGIILLAILVVSQLYYFFNQYFFVFPRTESSSFQYALSNVMPYVSRVKNKYKTVVISNRDNLYQSYMFYLFYTRYKPTLYLGNGGTVSGGFAQTHKIDNLLFKPISFKDNAIEGKTLYVGNPSDFPKSEASLLMFENLDGKPAVEVVSKNEN